MPGPFVPVMLCCNNPDNGMFEDRVTAVEYAGMELVHDDFMRGCALSIWKDSMRLSRRVFRIAGMKEWVGNWCWNAVWMPRQEARRMIRYLRQSGAWKCESGPTKLYDWFNRSNDIEGKP